MSFIIATDSSANLTDEIRRAFTEYVSDVREQKFPGPENSF